VKENYGGKVSDIIIAPQRDKDGALIRKNMQASKSPSYYEVNVDKFVCECYMASTGTCTQHSCKTSIHSVRYVIDIHAFFYKDNHNLETEL
jgi:hypothetical protein